MRVVDTNVVFGYLTGDDPEQSARARAGIEAGQAFVSVTVLPETERVLCSAYEVDGKDVAAALRAFAGLPEVSVEKPALLAEALDRAENGMDFADALHLGASGRCEAMLTFDRRFMAKDTHVRVTEP